MFVFLNIVVKTTTEAVLVTTEKSRCSPSQKMLLQGNTVSDLPLVKYVNLQRDSSTPDLVLAVILKERKRDREREREMSTLHH